MAIPSWLTKRLAAGNAQPVTHSRPVDEVTHKAVTHSAADKQRAYRHRQGEAGRIANRDRMRKARGG